MAYASKNYRTKKALKEAVAAGEYLTVTYPGIGTPKLNGVEYLEGPWYPAPHTWYAQVTVEDGRIIKVK